MKQYCNNNSQNIKSMYTPESLFLAFENLKWVEYFEKEKSENCLNRKLSGLMNFESKNFGYEFDIFSNISNI